MDTSSQSTAANNNQESAPHQPGELYREMFNSVLTGLIHGLNIHHGRIESVCLDDIMNGSDINPVTLEQYYKSARAILNEALSDLQLAIKAVEEQTHGLDSDTVIQILLITLMRYPLHLDVILVMDNRNMWEKHLKPLMKRITSDWPTPSEEIWDEVFFVFCFQFQGVLRHWSQSRYNGEELPVIMRRVRAWIASDRRYLELTEI